MAANYDDGVVWGPGHVGAPPQNPPTDADPFTAAERDVHAMVSAGWWPSAPPQQRGHAIAGRVLVLPDGTWWLFGAWARWYRRDPSDGQWYLCPPPRSLSTRRSARPAEAGRIPALPPHVVPAGPDFGFDAPTPRPFVGRDIPADLTARIRATVQSAAALPAAGYPHSWKAFSAAVPSTVPVSWGVMLWCAAAPVFDSRLDEQMLGLWSPYRAKPLPRIDGPRWLTPPPLEALAGLYAERLRSDRVDAGVVILRTMWAIASALREDARFRARADALLAILGPTLTNPTVDYGALPYGDQALVQQWLTRCPPHLAPAMRVESSPGDHFRHAYYDLAQAIALAAGDSAEAAYLEPRLVAAALIAADLAVVRQDVVDEVVPWLDPEIRHTVQAVLGQSGHPLRRLWPEGTAPPELLRGVGGDAHRTLLAAVYDVDLAWCRLAGGIPARPRGFPVPTAILGQIIGVDRAKAAPPEPVAPAPAIASPVPHGPAGPDHPAGAGHPAGPPYPGGPYPGGPLGPGGPDHSGRPGYPGAGPDQGFQEPGGPGGRPSQPRTPGPAPYPAWPGQEQIPAPPDARGPGPAPIRPGRARRRDDEPAGGDGPPQEPMAPAMPGPAASGEQPPGAPYPPGADEPALATRVDHPLPRRPESATPGGARPARTRVLGAAEATSPEPEPEPDPAPDAPEAGPRPAGTRIMSETMVGGFDFLEDTPGPAQPVDEIAPPPAAVGRPVTERFGVSLVYGDEDAGVLLDEIGPEASPENGPGAEPSAAASVLLVGAPHTGQRRLARLIALTLAGAGVGDGAIRIADAGDVRGATADRLAAVLGQGGPVLLFEGLDAAILESADPVAMAEAVRAARCDRPTPTTLIGTCAPRAYKRLAQDHPALVEALRVFELPDLTRPDHRLTLLHLLAGERRVTVAGEAMEGVTEDLGRLRGPGELVNARLVETYLEQACQRHLARAGAARDRLVLTPEDFAGVAEALEPALRPPGDVEGLLRRLDEMAGLEEVKRTVEGLVAEARPGPDRAHHGLPSGDAGRHLIFLGPPGVGKATVAGLLGGAYAALGLLGSGHIVACRPVHLAGRDAVDTGNRVASMVDRAMGGVLLIEQAHRLGRSPEVLAELLRRMDERRGKFMVICTGRAEETDGFLATAPRFRAEFGAIVEFEPPSDRELVRLFQRQAERDLYMLDEELRVDLLARFERMRGSEDFAYARTAHALLRETVARQGARLAGTEVDAATVARLSARDLPDSALEQMLGELHQDRLR